jgi:drug/metabolite transporter (DMT)-like permease|tara:strand:+ start:5773 stop:6648 length:876 start_codon:yes stop_codon:yes gene_type:complete
VIEQVPVNNRYGAVLLLAAAAMFTADVTVLRFLNPEVPFALIIFARSLCQLVIVALWIAFTRSAPFCSPRWPMLIVRGLTSLICWWFYYASFQKLDLALASTLTFTTSLFVVIMAPFVLGEKIGLRRGLTTTLGFLGVVLASGATSLTIKTGIIFGLGSAFAAAILIFQNRVMTRTEHTATIMLWIGLVATLGTLPGAVVLWTGLSVGDGLLLLTAGTLATLGMFLTVEAYRFGEVSGLATFSYARILFALIIGFLIFAEVATLRELVGATIIVICGFLANERRQPAAPDA